MGVDERYNNVVGGRLRLKGVVKKRPKKKAAERLDEERLRLESQPEEVDNRTDAQKRFDLSRDGREKELLRKAAAVTYRDQVERFNKDLSELPEAFDIPRVSHTK